MKQELGARAVLASADVLVLVLDRMELPRMGPIGPMGLSDALTRACTLRTTTAHQPYYIPPATCVASP
jgi:hypothetical protein